MRILRMPRRRATLPAVAALTISVALTGCSSGPDEDLVPVSPFETAAMPVDTAPTAVPGQHLAMGQIVALPQLDPTSTPDDIIETTVVGVAQGDVAFWETFDNASEFAGETPYFAVIQYRWVTGDVSAYTTPLLRPVLEDGTEGGIIQKEVLGALVSNTACPFDVGRFDLEDDRGPEEYIACAVLGTHRDEPGGAELAQSQPPRDVRARPSRESVLHVARGVGRHAGRVVLPDHRLDEKSETTQMPRQCQLAGHRFCVGCAQISSRAGSSTAGWLPGHLPR